MKHIRNNRGRISLLELVVIVFLVIEAIFLGIKGFKWYKEEVTGGNDVFLVNTAISTGIVNSLNGQTCPVNDCDHDPNTCTHRLGDEFVGYYDDTSHKILGYPVRGYNQNSIMRIGKKLYYGAPGTMVVQVVCHDDTVECRWVKSTAK